MKKVFITGGAGYVGAVLVPKMLKKGYSVKVLDLYLYGDVFAEYKDNPNLVEVKGDIRNVDLLKKEMPGYDTVIHLACISNDPSYELNPDLGKSINYDAFFGLVETAKASKVKNFIYASSSSVYGVKDMPEVCEDAPLEPLTDYSKFKALCEVELQKQASDDFIVTTIRPSTVCGYSPRQRLDLTVNILTNHAYNNRKIKVFGGEQMRPNIHIDDMADLYIFMLEQPDAKIHRKTYNVGYDNFKVGDIAQIVKKTIGGDISIEVTPTDDNRSYHVSSRLIKEELGFEAKKTLEDAIVDLKEAFEKGLLPNSFEDERYFNVKTMNSVNLT